MKNGLRGHALRFVICAAIGTAAGVAARLATGTPNALALGWDAAAISYTAHVWATLLPASADEMVAWSGQEDEGRWAITLLLTAAAAASGVAVFDMASQGAAALAALTILCSWTLVHTVFAAHYAHRCFSGGPKSPGLDFPGERPRFSDFAYYSFTIGMTFQTSDVDTRSGEMRRLTLVHSVVSFIFNTVIIAISVGLAGGLIGGN
ncbi:DUF1345 domain-containing protein [Chenggangzhangella methanolivorans]|uniref:DUF1345 domain-containing protein n=1 Tax=Chenggangzhangella methanolivorans TaxID=1437009 RepID=A0A9E6R8J3_9HYPH|nr:DUF1345 domain-containing protein [Chenggangzhangella methanolivorans]QZN99279.1 DUF1345 domain-containing protein [Chenggangzhangella methanolivorans]